MMRYIVAGENIVDTENGNAIVYDGAKQTPHEWMLEMLNEADDVIAEEDRAKYAFKLLMLDRTTGKAIGCAVHSSIILLLDADVLDKMTSAPFGSSDGHEYTAGLFAQLLSEAYGADIYYRRGSDFEGDWNYLKGYVPSKHDQIDQWVYRLASELARSKDLYPGSDKMLEALRGEVDELAAALADGRGWQAEALQVGAIALRIASEGDHAFLAAPDGKTKETTPIEADMNIM